MNRMSSSIKTISKLIILLIVGLLLISLIPNRNSSDSNLSITFISPYGTPIEPIEFTKDHDLTLPEVNYPGYDFLGWFDGENKVSNGLVTSSLILQAKFERSTYTLSFYGDIVESLNVLFGQDVILPVVDKPGFVFKGYYQDALLTVPFNETVLSDMTLYPRYEALGDNVFAVYFISPFTGLVEERLIDKNDKVEDFPILSKDGYVFLGWQLASEERLVDEGLEVTSNLVLVAVFESNTRTYTIRFNTGTDLVIPTVEVSAGTILELPESPILYGYQFIGWVTDITFDGFNVSSRRISEAFEVNKDMELFANFDYMIPSAHIFYEPFRYGGKILGYEIVDITFETDDVIDYMILPQTYLGLPVVSIGSSAFRRLEYIKEVVVPEGYLNLTENAFENSSIEIIHLPKSLEVLGYASFKDSSIKTIVFPNGSELISIGDNAFENTEQLKSFTVPKSVRTIGSYAFSQSQLETIVFEENSQLFLIENYAFYKAPITSIDLPESLISIEYSAFKETLLTSITFKENIQNIENESFANTPIATVVLSNPNNLKRLESDIFKDTKIIEGKHVLNIQGVVFGFDRALSSDGIDVIITEDVFMIAERAFSSVNINTLSFETDFIQSMKKVFYDSRIYSTFTLPKSDSFEETFGYSSLIETFTLELPLDAKSYHRMFNYTAATNTTFIINELPETSDSSSIFYEARVKQIDLKSNVNHLQKRAFAYTWINHLVIESQTLALEEEAMYLGNLVTYDILDDFKFILNSSDVFRDFRTFSSSFKMTDGYKTFGNVLLDASNVLTNDLVIPSGVTILAKYSLIRTINTLDLNETEYILAQAFQLNSNNYNAFTLNLTSNIKFVHPDFRSHWVVRPVNLVIGDAFQTYELLDRPVTKSSPIGELISFDQDGFKRIDDHIFDYDVVTFGKDVVIPIGVTSIASYTFENLNIASITSPQLINFIGYGAFQGNPELKNILVPQNHNDESLINAYDMNIAPSLSGMTLEYYRRFSLFYFYDLMDRKLVESDEDGFYIYEGFLLRYDGNKTDVIIPEGVITIYRDAFKDTLITSVTLPSTLRVIEDNAFSGTLRLREMKFDSSLVLYYAGNYILNGSYLTIYDLPTALNYGQYLFDLEDIHFGFDD